MRFLHIADVHLGYQQYNSRARFNDFSRAFFDLVDRAIERQVDFLLLAGDLFEKRTVDPLAMRVAIEGLRTLQEAHIPVLAVEGNHERAHYRDLYSWIDFLDGLGYLYLLNPRFEEGRAVLEPHGDQGGAYLDLPCGARVYGLKYYGASTGKVFGLFAEALAQSERADGVTIVLAHAGLEGQLAHAGTLTHNDLAPLRERVDYLALGHIHKPYAVDDWIFNPGSPETWNVQETAWRKRGSYLVEIEPGGRPQFEVIVPRRRPFYRLPPVAVDALETPQAVYDAVRAAARRQTPTIDRDLQPVIEVTLEGVLAFHRFDLDLEHVQQIVEEELSALLVRVRNQTTPAEFEIAVDAEASRPELEHDIVRELLERDARYRPAAEDWTGVALDLKRLALEDSAPAHVIDHLRRARAELLSGGEEG